MSVPAWGEIVDLDTMKSEMTSYVEVTEAMRAPIEDEMDEIGRLYRDIAERYRALKDDGSIKGYRYRRFREELEELKALMMVIREKI